MGSPVKTSYVFKNGTEGKLTFADNETLSESQIGIKLIEALVKRADHQLSINRQLSAYESAEFIKKESGVSYEKVYN